MCELSSNQFEAAMQEARDARLEDMIPVVAGPVAGALPATGPRALPLDVKEALVDEFVDAERA
jgi:hypothetical protein